MNGPRLSVVTLIVAIALVAPMPPAAQAGPAVAGATPSTAPSASASASPIPIPSPSATPAASPSATPNASPSATRSAIPSRRSLVAAALTASIAGTHDASPSTPWTVFDAGVDVALGNLGLQATDLTVPSVGFPTTITRTYDSLAASSDGPFGYGWFWSLGVSIVPSSGGVDVVRGDGRSDHYTLTGSTYGAPPGIYDTLTSTGGGGWRLTRVDQLRFTFDATGELTSIADPNGNTLSLTYASGQVASITDTAGRTWSVTSTSAGRIASITDPAGRTVSYSYSGAGDLVSVTDATGTTTAFTYTDHELTGETDANGHTTSYTYDTSGRVVSVTDPVGGVTGLSYDPTNKRTTITDPRGNAHADTYDAANRVTGQTDALGVTLSWSWDASNDRVAATDRNGNTTHATYDAAGDVTGLVDAAGGTSTATDDAVHHPLTKTDADGHTTTYQYDAHGNLVKLTDPAGHVTTYAYDSHGELVSTTDADGHTTTDAYDADGNLTIVTDPLGDVTTSTYDGAGNLVISTDPDSRVTHHTYDADGRRLSTTDGAGGLTSVTYDAIGNRLTSTDPDGNVTHFAYDAASRLVTTTDALGHTTTSAYDADGNLTSVTDPLGRVTGYAYDAANRLVTMTDALGHTTTSAYDADGNRTAVTDPNGHTTSYGYDALDRLVGVTDPTGGQTTYAYDSVGNLTAVTDPDGHTTTTTYDALNRPVAETDPLTHVSSVTYDGVGNVLSRTDANGITSSFTYDAANRLTSSTYAEGAVTYTYDGAGDQVQIADAGGATTFTYDGARRMLSSTTAVGTVHYSYDAAGNQTAITNPDGTTTSYAFDALNHETGVTDNSGHVSHFSYDAAGERITESLPNGTAEALTYDADGHVASIVWTGPGATVFAQLAYTYDADGNTTKLVTLAGTSSFAYDALDRLTSATYPGGSVISYTYDHAGNRTSMTTNGVVTTYAYDAANRLLSVDAATVTWDAIGNELSQGTTTYRYDSQNRLIEVTSGTKDELFAYDGANQRTSSSLNGTTTSYGYELNGSLARAITESNATHTQVYGLDGQVLWDDATDTGLTYYAQDALGSTVAITGPTGSLVGSQTYDAFGAPQGPQVGTGSYWFDGEQYDPTSGLFYLRARYYDPTTGRFLSPDPAAPDLTNPQSLNRYTFAANNPLRYEDPSGETMSVGQAQAYFAGLGVTETTLASLSLVATASSPATGPIGLSAGSVLATTSGLVGSYREGTEGWYLIQTAVSIAASSQGNPDPELRSSLGLVFLAGTAELAMAPLDAFASVASFGVEPAVTLTLVKAVKYGIDLAATYCYFDVRSCSGLGLDAPPASSPSGLLWGAGLPSQPTAESAYATLSSGPSGSSGAYVPLGYYDITTFPIPSPNQVPTDIIRGPDGNLWFTESQNTGAVGRVTPDGTVTEFSEPYVPVTGWPSPGLSDFLAGPEGTILFLSQDAINRMTIDGKVSHFALPDPAGLEASTPAAMVVGPDGNAWFTEPYYNYVGEITESGIVTEYPMPIDGFGVYNPLDIVVGPDNAVWFTEFGYIGKIKSSGDITLYPVALPGSAALVPWQIIVGPGSNLFFTIPSVGIGKITTQGIVTIFPASGIAQTSRMVVGPDGNIWFTTTTGAGVLTASGTVAEYGDTYTGGLYGDGNIAVGTDGNLWLGANSWLIRVTPTGAMTFIPLELYAVPYDFASGPDGEMWFTDAAGNTIGRVTINKVLSEPGPPTDVIGSGGDGSASVRWAAPMSSGGSPIIGYTVTSAPGSQTCTWTGGPLSCTVSGLTNGMAYTFTVTATNAIATGPASSPSGPVTPATHTISGSVTGSGGALTSPRVHVFDLSGTYVGTAVPDSGGAFSIVVPAGQYKLWIQPNTAGYVDQWYGGPDFTGATILDLRTADRTGLAITVTATHTISGSVTGSGGALTSPRVHVFDLSGTYVGTAVPDSGGAFSIVVPAGQYKLWIQPNTAGYVDQWYGGPDFTGATILDLRTADRTGLAITVTATHTISGSVTGSGGALTSPRVHVFDLSGTYVGTAVPDSGGAFSIVVPAGQYKLWIQPNTAGYVDQWYGGPDFTGATILDLRTADRTGLAITVTATHTISGSVTGSGGALTSPRVHVFDLSGTYVGTAVPDSGGAFSIVVPAGQYKLWIQPNTAGYVDQWYGGPDFTGATILDLRTADRTGLAITVTATHTISGSVTGSGGALTSPRVHVFDLSGTYVGTAVPDSGGAFSIVVPAGQYKLWIQPNTAGYVDQWYGGPDFTGATILDLRTADRTGLAITVTATHTISGSVTGSGGALTSPRVHVFDLSGTYVGTAVPDSGGAFSIVVPAGQYKLWIQPNTAGYVDQWYGGPDFTGATILDLRTADRTGLAITVTGP